MTIGSYMSAMHGSRHHAKPMGRRAAAAVSVGMMIVGGFFLSGVVLMERAPDVPLWAMAMALMIPLCFIAFGLALLLSVIRGDGSEQAQPRRRGGKSN